MGILYRSSANRKPNESMRLIVITFIGVFFGFLIGISFPTLSLTKLGVPSGLIPKIDRMYNTDLKSDPSTQTPQSFPPDTRSGSGDLNNSRNLNGTSEAGYNMKMVNTLEGSLSAFGYLIMLGIIWVPSNPRGAERLAPGIVAAESDFYLRRLWGNPNEDLTTKPKYLVTFTVGYNQRENIDKAVKKFSENFTILLFHYDGRTTEWDDFEWSKRAIHVSARKQSKWWYAKRFLHPDIVAPYDYIFLWDEDLGVENFDAEEYIKLVRKHGLEISQPGLEPNRGLTWQMTKKREDLEVHKDTVERAGWCTEPNLPPCAAFVEIMAPVFSREAWRCVWYMIQNDLIHGWGLDFAVRKCVEPAHEKIGVVDAQWIVHQGLPSLGSQGETQNGKAPWQGVRERCRKEWTMFQSRLANAEKAYFKSTRIDPSNSAKH